MKIRSVHVKSFKMHILTMYVIFVLIVMDPVLGTGRFNNPSEEAAAISSLEGEKYSFIDSIANKMSVLEAVDFHYNEVLKNEAYVKNNEKSAKDYAEKMSKVYNEIPKQELEYHYLVFKPQARSRLEKYNKDYAPVEPFAIAYVTYEAFLILINLKVCEILNKRANVVAGTRREYIERATLCKELFQYMHHFTFSFLKEKADDLERTETSRKLLKKIENHMLHDTEFTVCTVSNAADLLSKLDLDFMMDSDYLTNENRISRRHSLRHEIVQWGNVPLEKVKFWKKIRTYYPSDESITEGVQTDLPPEKLTDENNYDILYRKIMGNFNKQILLLEDFFRDTVIGSEKIWHVIEMRYLIPSYELSMKIWDKLSSLKDIKMLDVTKPRQIFDEFGGKMMRNNAVEIIRTILEITAVHKSQFVHQSAGDPNKDIPWIDKIRPLKGKYRCLLKREHGDVLIDYRVERTECSP